MTQSSNAVADAQEARDFAVFRQFVEIQLASHDAESADRKASGWRRTLDKWQRLRDAATALEKEVANRNDADAAVHRVILHDAWERIARVQDDARDEMKRFALRRDREAISQ